MIDPDRRIDQYHRVARRRGIDFDFGSLPPSAASRRPDSRVMSARNPAWSSAVFSWMPVISCALRISSSSRFKVVLICISMHISYAYRQQSFTTTVRDDKTEVLFSSGVATRGKSCLWPRLKNTVVEVLEIWIRRIGRKAAARTCTVHHPKRKVDPAGVRYHPSADGGRTFNPWTI